MTTYPHSEVVCSVSDDALFRFAEGQAQRAERREVLEHLLRGCHHCRAILDRIQTAETEPSMEMGDDSTMARVLANLRDKTAFVEMERTKAASQIAGFMEHPSPRQWTLIRNSHRYDSSSFCILLLDRAFQAIYDDPRRSNDLAEMALTLAERLDSAPAGPGIIVDLIAQAHGQIANSQRALGNLAEAGRLLSLAKREIEDGTGDPLLEAQLHYFESSLHRANRDFPRALRSVRTAARIYRELGDDHHEGQCLVNEAVILSIDGKLEDSLRLIEVALPLVDPERDPHLALGARHNLVWRLMDLGRGDEAQEKLDEFRADYEALGDRVSLGKRSWLEAKIHCVTGLPAEAEVAFEDAIAVFADLDLPYEVAMISLDLAGLLAERGRFAEMKELAAETLVIFRSLGIGREAIAAWLAFQSAVEAEAVTASLIGKLASYYSEAKLKPELAFRG